MNFRQSILQVPNPKPIFIVGAGGIVSDAHLPAYQKAGWRVQGIYDISPEKAMATRDKFPFVGKVFSHLEDLIRAANLQDAIIDLAVPADQVLSILEMLPERTPVLIQKPMGETLVEARQILDLCNTKALVAAINFQLKFAPYMLALEDMLSQGLLGEIYDMELKVCVHTPWELWDFLKTKKRMEVLYHSIHYLDLIRHLAGNPVRVLSSLARHPLSPELADARSSVLLEYEGFKQARILTNHGHDFGSLHQESYLKVEGTQGAVFIQMGLSLDYPKGRSSKMEYCLKNSGFGWKEIPLLGDWFPDAFVGSMAVLQNYLQDSSQPMPHSVESAFQTMELVEKVYQSANNTK